MKVLNSCKEAIDICMRDRTFTLAHLYSDEKPKNVHIHNNYEIYFSVIGGKQFLIDQCFYSIRPGDLFFINQYESHYPSQFDSQLHERIVLSIDPNFLKGMNSDKTDLTYCFSYRSSSLGHKISLTEEEQKRFLYEIHRLSSIQGYGAELLEKAVFLELMVYLNEKFLKAAEKRPDLDTKMQRVSDFEKIDEILSYIDGHIQNSLTIEALSQHFYISPSYLCRIFKSATGTTINKYLNAKRISRAKVLLSQGHMVSETAELCGFHDYSNFLKAFSKTVGISPKKYAQFSRE